MKPSPLPAPVQRRPNALFLAIPLILLALGSVARAGIQPALPGSIEHSLISSGQSWVRTSDPIVTGSYVEDLLTFRLHQPDGRGVIGIVTGTGFNADYGVMGATVDFGRDYSVGIVFPELSAVQIVPEPTIALLVPSLLLWSATRRRRPAFH